jgi:hypothetical protein
LWGASLRCLPDLADLSWQADEASGDLLAVRVRGPSAANRFLLGRLAGALTVLADGRGLCITVDALDPLDSELRLTLAGRG